MYCMHCGTQNTENSKFCAKCGSPLEEAGNAATPQNAVEGQVAASEEASVAGAAVEGSSVAQPAAEPVAQPAAQQASASAYGATPTPAPVPAPAPATAQEGVIGAAWNDIKSSPGWLKHVLMLCLIGCVPIMNFAVDGYCIRWGRDLAFGKRSPLPKTIFKKKEISTGFFAYLVAFALSFALTIVVMAISSLLSGIASIPSITFGIIVSGLLTVAAFLFSLLVYGPCINASVMRMSIVGFLESGFNFRKVFDAFKKAPGGLIGASVLPRLIVGFVAVIVIGIIVAIVIGIAVGIGSAAVNGASSYYPYGGYGYGGGFRSIDALFGLFSGAATILIFFFVAIYILASMFNVFATLLTYRAIGHWAARNAPEWANEAEDATTSEDDGGNGASF